MTSYVHKEKINRILSVLVVYALMFQVLVPFAAAMNTINDGVKDYSIYNLDKVHPHTESIEISEEFATSFNTKSSQKVSSVVSVSGGPGQTDISGSTANMGGGLVNSFTGDLTYSLPLMNVEGFPIVLSYDPNISMDQEASWVGLGWNLSLGSINREMRGIPDDFKGDEVERTVKMKENTVDGKGWSANLTAGYGNNVSLNLSGTATILGGDVNMSANGNVGLGISYSRGKYTNNYTGDGRTRSFNLSGSLNLGGSASASVLTIGADGAFSGGIGFNKDSQNGKGFSQYFSHNVGGSASIFGVGYDAGYSGFGNTTSNSRSGVKSNDSGFGTSLGPTFSGNSYMHGSHRTFGAQTFVPRFSSGNSTSSSYTAVNFNLSTQLGFYSAGGGGGKNTHESNTTVLQETIKYPAYGYQNHSRGQKDSRSMLDFNRERNSAVSTATQLLSFSVQTYDVFYCSAPGFSASFRPHRYDVVEYHDPTIQSTSNSQVPKGDIKEQNVHGGINMAGSPTGGYTISEQGATSSSITQSGAAIEQSYFNGVGEENTFNEKEYYLKTQGELSQVDLTLLNAYQGAEPKLLDMELDPMSNEFRLNGTLSNGPTGQLNPPSPVTLPNQNYSLVRSENAVHYIERTIDEMAIPKVYSEVTIVENVPHISEVNASFVTEQKAGHHTGSIEVVSNNGMRYIYGVPTYNYLQKEVSFSASGRIDELFYKSTGLLQYQEGVDNTTNNSLGRHESFEQTITPAYSTAFLLTEMLTSDFVDRTGDGPSVDDQGNYYLLKYSNPYNGRNDDGLSPDVWKWRMPLCSNLSSSVLGDSYEKSLAYANKNMYSDKWDDMGSYIYGEKDIWYNSVVESKNMLAFFVLEDRKDQFSMIDENGGLDQTKPGKLLKRILLYAKNDLLENPSTAKALQIVEFEYSYELCQNYVGNINTYSGGNANTTGKLTLKKIYVYSGKSGEGKTTPISFEYSEVNPSFAFNSSDRWGNYKPNNTSLPNHEFPYAEQGSNAETNILAWKLVSVEQSAGTKLNISYKPDDYAKVQNKRAMRMFNVVAMSSTDDLNRISGGAVDNNNDPIPGSIINNEFSLYAINPSIDHYRNPNDREDFYNVVYFKLEEPIPASTPNITEKIKKEYLTDETGSVVDKLYFKMHTRLDNNNILPLLPEPYSTPGFEYVESEVFIGKLYTSSFCGVAGISDGSSNYAYEYGWVIIEAEDVKEKSKDKYKDAIGEPVPSALDSDIDDDEASDILLNPLQIAAFQFAQANVPCMIYGEINYGASGPTEFCDYNLQNDGNIYGINLYKRLNKKEYALKFDRKESLVRLYDPNNVKIGGGCRIEKITITDNWFDYSGQDEVSTEYSYEYDYGQVSNETHGVASYEPQIGNNENPFYTFLAYDLARNRMPDERVYQKDPWGELAFPGASVGYSEVKSSLFDGSVVGYSIEEFYTLADEGTKTKRTNIKKHELAGKEDAIKLNKYYKEVFGFSQGFYIETSDFHGKPKTTSTYDNGGNLISKSTIEYYGEDESLKFIDSKGEIITSLTPRDIDIHTDSWRTKSYTFSQRSGSTTSVGFTGPFPIYRDRDSDDFTVYENALNAYTFNKVIHRYAIPKAIQTTYLGSKNTARNEYFDLHSGEVIVSSLKDEYNDKLYSISYPGHWYYENFDNMASNDGAILKPGEFIGTSNTVQISNSIHGISFHEGDKLKIYEQTPSGITNIVEAWLLHDLSGNFTLIDEDGISINTINWNNSNLRIKIERTGAKNILSASMMGVTTKKLDAPVNTEFSFPTTNVLSSSAAKFAQNSNVACVPLSQIGTVDMNNYPDQLEPGNVINPYLKGVKGNYRHLSSFAFQEERDESDPNNLRQNAVLSNYEPFYALDNGEWYSIDESNHPNNTSAGNYNKWRQLGLVNKFDEFGKPLQSKDQINVSSAVAYGMNGDLKLISKATAMNAEATEIGFDGFEDYAYFTNDNLDYQNYGFSLKPSNAANIVSSQKHSGKYSLKVQGQLEFTFDTEVAVAQPSANHINEYVVEACDCIQGFAPKAGEEYFLSTWVHENTLVYPFSGSSVSLQFYDVNGSFISSTQLFTPEGAVIDGWQKIEGKYTIPSQAKSFKVVLIGNSESFFDDFRIHPNLAGMTTVVYDQKKLLPIAEHDGYNYTTFYHYDENNQLVRVRVETIEGIKTISESESGSSRN